MRPLPKYVTRRTNTSNLYFKKAIPQDVSLTEGTDYTDKTQIVVSLKTDSPSLAGTRAAKLAEKHEEVFQRIREGGVQSSELLDQMDYLLNQATRQEIDTFMEQYVEYVIDDIHRWLEADQLPSVKAIIKILGRQNVKFTVVGNPTEGALRRSLKAVLGDLSDMCDRLRAELSVQRVNTDIRMMVSAPAGNGTTCHMRTVDSILEEMIDGSTAKAAATIKLRRVIMDFVGDDKEMLVSDALTKERVLAYKATLIERLATSTAKNQFGVLHRFTKYCHAEGLIPTAPTANIQMPKVTHAEKRTTGKLPYTSSEVRAVIEATHGKGLNPTYGSLIRFTAYMGCRVGEALGLDGSCINQVGEIQTVTLGESVEQHGEVKTDQSIRTLPLTADILADEGIMNLINTAKADGGLVFARGLPWRDDGTGFTGRPCIWFCSTFKKVLTADGKVNDIKRKDVHSLRRSFISTWEHLELDSKRGMEVTGHARSDISLVHAGYVYKTSDEKALSKVKKFMEAIAATYISPAE